jgi:hypothetical protein
MRTRTNGLKFEDEVAAELTKQKIYFTPFHTPQGYAGIHNPSDFLVVCSTSILLETKETKANSFSLYTMQQREQANKFIAFKESMPKAPMQYVVLIHFIARATYTVALITSPILPRQTVKVGNEFSFDTLKEAIQKIKEIK